MLRKFFTIIVCLVANIAITSAQTIPDNEIWFTTNDGKAPAFFEENNLSSLLEYRDDMMVIKFDDSVDINYIIANAFKYKKNITSITIGNGVTEIGDSAFLGCDSLTSVTMGDSVTKIGVGAFNICSNLKNLTISNGVTEIGAYAFSKCKSLSNIIIPESVTKIGSIAFKDCGHIGNITIPKNVTEIEGNVFEGCWGDVITINCNIVNHNSFQEASFSKVVIGDGVTKIGKYAFRGCLMGTITIPDSVTEIGFNAFGGCKYLKSITIPNGVTKIEDQLFYNCSWLSSVTIGSGVTEIGEYAFYNCDCLKSITIPDSVTKIGSYAFKDCSGIRTITIGKGVSEIASNTFSGCGASTVDVAVANKYCYDYFYNKYKGVKVLLNSEYTSQDGKCLIVDEELVVAQIPGVLKYEIPEGVTKIGWEAFKDCTRLTSITIPDGVTEIGAGAFKGCSCLTNITIPDSVTKIGENAFEGCSSLKSVNATNSQCYDSLKSSGMHISAFTGPNASADGKCLINNGKLERFIATGLKSYDFPESVNKISAEALNECKKLQSATVANNDCYTCIKDSIATVRFSGSNASSDGRCLIINGKLMTFIGNDLTEYVIPQDVTNINDGVFNNCGGLTSITIPSGVTSIGDQQFNGCNALASITCLATTPPAISDLSIAETTMIYVSKNAIKEYKKEPNWAKYKKQIKPIN